MRAFRSVPFGLLVPSALLAASGCAELPTSSSDPGPSLYTPTVAPSALILSPEGGESLASGESWSFVGRVSDADGEPSELTATWSYAGEVICEDVTPDADGIVTCETDAPAGAAEVELSVVDLDGLSASTTVEVSVEAGPAPTIDILPPDAQKNYSDVAVTFTGTIDGSGDLSVFIESHEDGAAPFDIEVEDDGSFTASAILSPGDHVITASVTDGEGNSGFAGTTVFVDGPNSAPDCVVLTPDSDDKTTVGDPTTITGHVDDADVGPAPLRVVWSSDLDGYLGEGDFDTITGQLEMDAILSEGTHAITLTAVDEVGARCQDTIEHVVGNAPSITVEGPTSMVDEGDAVELTATIEDAAYMTAGLVVQWSVGGELLDITTVDETGITTLTTTALPHGNGTVLAQVTDADGWSVAGATDVLVNGRPSPPVLSGGGRTTADQALEASMVSLSKDPEDNAISYRYEWAVNGSATTVSTSMTFPAGVAARGDEVTLYAYANDGRIDSIPAMVSFVIDNAAPEVTSVSMVPSAPASSDIVRCSAGTYDADGDAVSMQYAWFADGRQVATGETLPAGIVSGGAQLECRAQAIDGMDGGFAVSSPVTMLHSAPSLMGLSFASPEAFTDSVLTAGFVLEDLDKGEPWAEYAWTVNGAPAGNDEALRGADWFDMGDVVELTVTPVDENHRGTPASVTITIGDAPLVEAEVSFASTKTREGEDLVCVIDAPAYDPDGDAVSHTIAWYVDESPWAGATYDGDETGDTIDGADMTEGENWTCVVTATSTGGDDAISAAERVVKAPAMVTEHEALMSEVLGAADTCTGDEAVVDGSLSEPTMGWSYIAVPFGDERYTDLTEVSITLEAAACNTGAPATGTLMWAIVGPDLTAPIASGEAAITVDGGCTCPDSGEVLELTAPVDGEFDADTHQLVFTVDADAFGIIDDGAGNAADVTFTH